jgi:hypothetical protein
VIVKQFFSKLSDVEESKFVYDRHEKCGKQGKGSVNQKLRHHGAGIKEQVIRRNFTKNIFMIKLFWHKLVWYFEARPV